MKRIIALSFLIGIVAFGLMGCLRESESATNNEDTTVAVVDNGAEIVAVADTESVDAEENVGDAETPVVANATETADDGTRGPILVLGNADFTSDNGVVGGTGTENDPYIIAGWEIIVPAGEYYGVRIENVTAQFVLRGLIIRDATENSGAGIRIAFASGGAIEGCSISSSLHGIDIISSTDISMDNCVVQVSGRGFRVVGESEDQYRHAIADTNLYNNNPIYYFYGLENDTISDLRGGHLTVAGSRNVTISNNEIVNGDGLLLAFVEDSTVTLNVVHRTANVITDYGIHLYESHNNEVMENGIKNNRLAGLQLTLSNSNTIVNNEIYVNDTGIRLLASNDNEASGNLIISNATGILALGGASGNRIYENLVIDNQGNMAQGIVLETSMSNEVQRNLIFGSENGIMLEAQAFGNSVTDNTVVSCGYGLYVSGTNNTIEGNLLSQHAQGILFPETFQRSITRGNTFRGNVLAENGNHVYTNMDSAGNLFAENVFLNDGRALVRDQGTGNVWTVDGLGNFWGFNSVIDADGDGIGDSPVEVDPSGADDTAPLAGIDVRQLGLGIVGTLELGSVSIETKDGDRIEIPAYVASKLHERATGFRGFPSELIAESPGILFVFESEMNEVTDGFTMHTVSFDLDIAFFSANGDWAGGATMSAEATALYTAGAPFQYALELPAGSLEEFGIGAGSKLVLP